MTPSNTTLTSSCEIDSIKRDAEFYIDLMSNLTSKQSMGILIFGLLPYMSLFTVETYKYLQSNFPLYARTITQSHEKIVSASRIRIKLFDDTDKRTDGVLQLLKWIIEFNEEWYIKSHKGLLAPLKRALQDDLGIFFYDNHIIGSTHVGLFNIGYEKKDLPSSGPEIYKILGLLSKSVGEDLGKYLGPYAASQNLHPSVLMHFFRLISMKGNSSIKTKNPKDILMLFLMATALLT